jgi:two-component system nitrate/nitrite response regulator NarL
VIKLLVIDDDLLMTQALASGLANQEFESIQTANNASEAMKKFRIFKPDVCLIDIDLKLGPTGIDIAHAIRKIAPDVGIVFLTSLSDPRLVDSAIPELPKKAAYLRKDQITNLADIAEIIHLVHEGKTHNIKMVSSEPNLLKLTKSQFELIRLIAEGHTNLEISKLRVTSVKSTENGISRLAKKLGITNSSVKSQRVLLTRKYMELIGKI